MQARRLIQGFKYGDGTARTSFWRCSYLALISEFLLGNKVNFLSARCGVSSKRNAASSLHTCDQKRT
jgi:hypothetical protein